MPFAHLLDLPTAKHTRHTHAKVRYFLGRIHEISKALFLLVATSVSATNIASLRADEIIPRIEHWWKQHPPSDTFAAHADDLLCTLEERRRQGGLAHSKMVLVHFHEDNDTDLIRVRGQKHDISNTQKSTAYAFLGPTDGVTG